MNKELKEWSDLLNKMSLTEHLEEYLETKEDESIKLKRDHNKELAEKVKAAKKTKNANHKKTRT